MPAGVDGGLPSDAGTVPPRTVSSDVAGCTEPDMFAVAPDAGQVYLERAYGWIDGGVMYCQCVTSQSTPYRADCSGYVSYLWGLPAPGDTTQNFAGGASPDGLSFPITWDQLQIGDALNFPGDPSVGTGHIMLFGGWLDRAHTRLCALEEQQPGSPAMISQYGLSDPGSWWGATDGGTLGQIFLPIRKR